MKSGLSMPTKDGKQFQALAESFDFHLVGSNGRGHAVWRHPSFGEFTTSKTPRSRYAWRNARRDLFLMMGVRPPTDGRRRAPERVSALNRLTIQARERGYGLTQSQAQKLLVDFDGDLTAAESALSVRCDYWDMRRVQRARATERRPAEPRRHVTGQPVDRSGWPLVRERIIRDLRFELASRGRMRALEQAHSARKLLGRQRCQELVA